VERRENPLPETYLPVFAARQEFMAIAQKLDEDRRAVEKLAATPAGFYLRKELQHLCETFRQIKYVVTHTASYTVAPRNPTSRSGSPKSCGARLLTTSGEAGWKGACVSRWRP
jgi:hypothetical protein